MGTNKSGADYVYEAGLTVRTAMDPAHQNAPLAQPAPWPSKINPTDGRENKFNDTDAAKKKESLRNCPPPTIP